MSKLKNKSLWFGSYAQKALAIALPIAAALAVVPYCIGFFAPQIASVFLISTYILVFLAIFGMCLILLGFQNLVAHRLALVVGIAGIIGAFSHYWLLIEVFFFDIPITYPNVSSYVTAIANLILLAGFAFLSVEQRRRSWRQIGGYLLITFLFLFCIFTVYQMNLIYHPPIFPAIGSGLRIFIGFLTAIFAWTFYFNQDPPREIIGRLSRGLLVFASLILMLSYTIFAFQYAVGFTIIAAFYYGGSISDIAILFAIFLFLIAVLTIFSDAMEKMTTIRPISIRYELVTRIVFILSIIAALTLVVTIAIALTRRVLLVYLSPFDVTIALQTIGTGVLISFSLISLTGGIAAYYLSQMLYRPLERLQEETAAVTEPGAISYMEPAGLLFTELQKVSDSYSMLIEELGRVRAEMRRFTISESRLRIPSTSQLARLDYYMAILTNMVSNRIQSILSLTELAHEKLDHDEQKRIFQTIRNEVTELQSLLNSIQLLRLIDTKALPELSRVDLCLVLSQLITELRDALPSTATQISFSVPDQKCLVLANEYLIQVFQSLFRLILEQDVGGTATIEVKYTTVTESGVDYWQVDIIHPKLVLSDIEKALLFRSDPEQPQKANPSLLLVPALVEYFRGKFRVNNIVVDDPRYGTVFQVLLQQASHSNVRTTKKS